eukprot:2404251-Prymnesium_polylepis.1
MAAEATGFSAAPRLAPLWAVAFAAARSRCCRLRSVRSSVLAAHPPRLAYARHPPHPLGVRLPAGGR